MITDHVWRAFNSSIRAFDVAPGACAFMNCRRPKVEHARKRSLAHNRHVATAAGS